MTFRLLQPGTNQAAALPRDQVGPEVFLNALQSPSASLAGVALAAAGLALSATAFGAAGDLTPIHPVDGNFEVVYIGTQGNNLVVVSPSAVGTAVVRNVVNSSRMAVSAGATTSLRTEA